MKTLFNQYTLLVLGIACLWGSLVFGMTNEPTEFRGMAWGSNISEFTDMVLEGNISEDKTYTKNNDNMKIGEATLDRISYTFYKDRFYSVTIQSTGLSNFTIIKETFFQLYGLKDPSTQGIEDYSWISDKILINLNYNKMPNKVIIFYYYRPIIEEKVKDKLQQTISGADD